MMTGVFLVGAIVSLGASAVLVVRLERLAFRLGAPEAILGLVAALAADGPEITSAIAALVRGNHDVGTGVVLGSNVFNLAALLGLAAILAVRIRLHRTVVLLAGSVALWIGAISVGVALGVISADAGLVLALLLFAPYVIVSGLPARRLARLPLPSAWVHWLRWALQDEERELLPAIHPRRGGARDGAIAGLALVVVIVASIAMEQAATSLGDHFAIPDIVVGAVVLAAVTSLPNAVAAVYLARRGRGSAVLSEALNSNNINVLCGLLLPAVILGLSVASHGGLVVAAWYTGLTAACLGAAWVRRGLGRRSGVLIIGAYVVFVCVLVIG